MASLPRHSEEGIFSDEIPGLGEVKRHYSDTAEVSGLGLKPERAPDVHVPRTHGLTASWLFQKGQFQAQIHGLLLWSFSAAPADAPVSPIRLRSRTVLGYIGYRTNTTTALPGFTF